MVFIDPTLQYLCLLNAVNDCLIGDINITIPWRVPFYCKCDTKDSNDMSSCYSHASQLTTVLVGMLTNTSFGRSVAPISIWYQIICGYSVVMNFPLTANAFSSRNDDLLAASYELKSIP